MASIDIRDDKLAKIDEIVFADTIPETYVCYKIQKDTVYDDGYPCIVDSESDYVLIGSEEDARNLIKALQKAISLGWWE